MIRAAFGRGDPWLLFAVLLMMPLGVLMVHSASLDQGSLAAGGRISAPALRQLLVAVAGVVAVFALPWLDYRALRRLSAPAYIAMGGLLVIVLVAGISEFGARRWLGVGSFTLQPSELAKLALVLVLAAYLSERSPRPLAVLGALGLLAMPLALIALEPDTGTALVLGGAWLGVMIAWGAPWRLLGTMLAVALALLPLLFALVVPGYQRERIAVFLDPGRDPLGSGFNLQQAEVALRSGGLTGQGLFGGAQSALSHVGARSSDFIFAQLGEELGLVGALTLLGLFALLIWRGLRAAQAAPDRFGRLLAAGLTITIFTQAFVHVAANLRLIPATGVPLPFISQGGSSLLVMCLAVGLLQSVAAHRPPSAREQWRAERWR